MDTVSVACAHCEQHFTKSVTNQRKRFCSRTCKNLAAHYRRPEGQWRRAHLKRSFGITEADFDQMLIDQGGRCAICGSAEPKGRHNTQFMVDHDHESGVVRGLLCGNCNVGLGNMGDDAGRLRVAADYLERYL